MQRLWKKPELMSRAGYWPQLKTATEAGADAVYFGLTHFTARAKVGFGLAELPEVMRTLHARGVKGFVTFNNLLVDGQQRDLGAYRYLLSPGDLYALYQVPELVRLGV